MVCRSAKCSVQEAQPADAQALIFIIKREFMLVGWMVVYILAYVS